MEDGRTITYDLYTALLPSELDKIKEYVGASSFESGKFEKATQLFDRLIKDSFFIDFLTLPAYDMIQRSNVKMY